MLDGLGLSSDQEAVYVALVDVSSATLEEISQRCPGVLAGQQRLSDAADQLRGYADSAFEAIVARLTQPPAPQADGARPHS